MQNEVFIDYKQILPNLPLIHPEKAVSSICLAKREDAVGIELVQMKSLFLSIFEHMAGFRCPQHSSSIIKLFLASHQPFYSRDELSLVSRMP